MAIENDVEKLKQKYKKFKFAVEIFDKLENPSYYKVKVITGIDYNSIVRYLDDWDLYQVVYGVKAKTKYDAIQEKIKIMNEEKDSKKDNEIIKEAKEFLESNNTFKEFIEKKNISEWTLQKHFRQLQTIDPKLYSKVKEQKEKRSLDNFHNKIIAEAKFFLEHNYTLSKTEEELGLGKRVLYEHFKRLETIDPKLSAEVKEKQDNNYLNQIIEDAKEYLKSDLSYADYIAKKGINKRTLASRFMRLKDIDLELYDLVKEKQAKMTSIKDDEYLNDIIETANYYLKHDYTVAKLAEEKGINKSTLLRRFQKLAEADPELYSLIRQKQGLSLPTYSDEGIDSIVNVIIYGEYTLDELAKSSGITANTLYNCILKSSHLSEEKKAQVKKAYQASRSNKEKDNKTI